MATAKNFEKLLGKPIVLTQIEVLDDFVEDPEDPSGPVAPGTIVEAYITKSGEEFVSAGEAWYIRPDTEEEWLSLPGDFRLV